ncbi:diadenylate cyclase [Ilumatobacter sp.]|uniref:diadenylate cyclase n=1 Tax=Ilumatobacter sp. TaxID=1967498 RepID=UPI003B521D8F
MQLTRAHERLREEPHDDGITLPGSPDEVDVLITELEHAWRPPVFENHTSIYGSFVLPGERSLVVGDNLVEIVDLDMPIELARRFADGRSAFLVRARDGSAQLACFRRTVQYEADLVEIEQATGAVIVQRTVMGMSRVFTPTGVVEWNGHRWRHRPSAKVYLPAVRAAVPEASSALLLGLLDLAVHWLSPARIGATFLLDLDPVDHDDHGLDMSAALPSPDLSVLERHHFAALFAVLNQTDLATLVGADGAIGSLGVGLRSSIASESAVHLDEGMRHRSAARYTWDHDHTVAFVVSEDGPVTLFRRGQPIAVCIGVPD